LILPEKIACIKRFSKRKKYLNKPADNPIMTQELTTEIKELLMEYLGLKNIVMTKYELASKIIELETPILKGIGVDSTEWTEKLPKLIKIYQSELSKIIEGMKEKVINKMSKKRYENVVTCTIDEGRKSSSLIQLYNILQDFLK